MATYSRELRRGLPRRPGGEPWPPAGAAPLAFEPADPVVVVPTPVAAPVRERSADAVVAAAEPVVQDAPAVVPTDAAPVGSVPSTPVLSTPVVSATVVRQLRRGLPRVPGGEPWPPAREVEVAVSAGAAAHAAEPAAEPASGPREGEPAAAHGSADTVPQPTGVVSARAAADTHAESTGLEPVAEPVPAREVLGLSEVPLRRGLPRRAGGDPWPAAGFAPMLAGGPPAMPATPAASKPLAEAARPAEPLQPVEPVAAAETVVDLAADPSVLPVPETVESPGVLPANAASSGMLSGHASSATRETDARETAAPTDQPAHAAPTAQPAHPAKPRREPVMVGSRTLTQFVRLVVLIGVGSLAAAGIIVLAARGLTTLPGVPEFVERYPGEYHSPVETEDGFPAWARWSHYLNFFFLVLIVRTGLLVRTQQKPDAFYTPKKGGKKVSIYLWLHTAVDLLWLANGIAFVVLLFVSGHWARIVPTSWEVFPNAVSAMLQYLTLEWPVEDGWVNYNSLQQLMYFTVVFLAAPLAAVTGVRMSEWWPQNAERLNKFYPAPVARALHFPTMLFFVLFVIVHVFLVFATGALKNLNHMFAGTPEPSWVGFWWFAGGLALAVAAVAAARPLVIAPIASLFGRVSNR